MEIWNELVRPQPVSTSSRGFYLREVGSACLGKPKLMLTPVIHLEQQLSQSSWRREARGIDGLSNMTMI